MNRLGHFGFSLFASTLLFYLLGLYTIPWIIRALFIAILSWIPDIDLKLNIKHRGVTHTIYFAVAMGIIGYLIVDKVNIKLFYYGLHPIYDGFLIPFMACITHIIADSMTVSGVKIFAPIKDKTYGLRMFRSDNPIANLTFTGLGLILFYIYFNTVIGIYPTFYTYLQQLLEIILNGFLQIV